MNYKSNKGSFKKGHIPWLKGKHFIMSDEQKKKISKALTGKKKPESMKQKMKERMKYWHPMITKEAREKSRLSHLGKKFTQETKEKMSKARKGIRNGNWKGGLTPLYYKIRNSFEYRQWRSDVFTKDKFSCSNCGSNHGRDLNAHHIEEFNKIIIKNNIKTFEEALNCSELWNINNGITLCEKCHVKIHLGG